VFVAHLLIAVREGSEPSLGVGTLVAGVVKARQFLKVIFSRPHDGPSCGVPLTPLVARWSGRSRAVIFFG